MANVVACPSCGEMAPDEAKWCEACGEDLNATPADPCTKCGERDISEDGYCMSCGHKQPEERDHMEFEDGAVVAVTDRGIRHRHNEDSAAIGALQSGGAVLVVCDGVSSTPGSAEASLAAAAGARDLLVSRLDGADLSEEEITEALVSATEVAQGFAADAPEVLSNAPHVQDGPPSSTFVAAVARPVADGTAVSAAWLGDSRAYWLQDGEAVQLTEDHEIEGSLTRWLGADSADALPDVRHHVGDGPGRLLLCSDGLWRYADPAMELAELVGRLESDHTTTKELAAALVQHALSSGGHDNITVALWASWPQEQPAAADVADVADVERAEETTDVETEESDVVDE